ncbi:hypothetical protein EJD97_022149 [Solanum chilense]|uniref:Uncharacterized protein n=1 Tax=Solanum chilense TaxID=4083 RepID=A0A6N2CBF0_SOLCI|nr:hypothetical protein EJD97_022149 [Solanum chilense]
MTVRRWHRIEAAEGRWGNLTKCGATECVTDHHSHDYPPYWLVMKFREVVPVPKFQEFKCYGMETINGPLCMGRSVIPAVEGNEESNRRICKYGTTKSMTAHRDHNDPSRGPTTQPHFDIFPAYRVLI